IVLTLMGSTPEWVVTLLACWRIGAVALPCNEQLRPHDLAKRIDAVGPSLAVVAERNRETFEQAGVDVPVLEGSGPSSAEGSDRSLAADDPALVIFTSGTSGEPKPVRHGHGYLAGQAVQAEHWLGARPGDLCW